jgi:hypothetical protein
VDLGKLQDYTAICVLDAGSRHLVHFERLRGMDWPRQRARIAVIARRFPGALWIDSTGLGEVICDDLWREGLRPSGYCLTADAKEQLVMHLELGLEDADLSIPKCAETLPLLEELAGYEYRLTPGGRVGYGAPAGGHDDCVIALALAYWGLRHAHTASRI